MAKGQETTTEDLSCPACKTTTMKETAWPPKRGGLVLFVEGVLFVGIFIWYSSGALVKGPSTTGSDIFLNYFRSFLPLLVGLGCLAWGWMALTGRAGLGGAETVWHCPSCEHAQSKIVEKTTSRKK